MAAAPRVHIVTSTSTCLDPERARELGVTLVALRIAVDGRDLRDIYDISPGEVYRLLRAGQPLSTSSPTPGDYAEAFRGVHGPILCLTEGAGLSASNGAARVGAQVVAADNSQIEVLDTGTAAGGLRLLTLAAASLAAQGATLPEVADRVRELSGRIEMAGMLDTVDYLGRSGRIPEVAYWGGSLLKVRPVVRFSDGRGKLVALARSPLRGIRELHGLVLRAARRDGAGPCGEGLRCTVFHADAEQLGGELAEGLRRDLPGADLSLSEMTPAMGIHTGPGVVGYALHVEAG